MNADTMEMMVDDFIADHAEEMEDIVLDGKAYYSEDLDCWCMDAHDGTTDYTFTEDGNGNVILN